MIFEVEFNLTEFTGAQLDEADAPYISGQHLRSREPMIASWQVVRYLRVDPELPEPHFFSVFENGIVGVVPSVLRHVELKGQFTSSGELLPVKFGVQDAYLFHPVGEFDALDQKRSRFRKMSTGYSICSKPVFRSSFHTMHWFFRVPGSGVLFTTSEFVDYYQGQAFTGLEFVPQRMAEA